MVTRPGGRSHTYGGTLKKTIAIAISAGIVASGAVAIAAPAQADSSVSTRAVIAKGKKCKKVGKVTYTVTGQKLVCGKNHKWKKMTAATKIPGVLPGGMLLPAAPALPCVNCGD